MTESAKTKALPDIPHEGIVAALPASWRPYARLARLDRPIGTWLLLWPCWWSIALASDGSRPDFALVLLFGLGAVVMRGAGCTFNDIVDREYDGRVARTATRPIPSGEVSLRQAFAFMVVQALVGLAILLALDPLAIQLGVISLVIVAVYPFMKRFTHWPQFVLGLAFNWGALMGWAAVKGELDFAPVMLYVGGIFWTLGYDTIYAHQDKEDDALLGLKSTALRFGDKTRPALVAFYGCAMVCFVAAGRFAGLGDEFLLGMAAASAHLVWQIARLDIDYPTDCLAKFKSNRDFGFILLGAILLGQYVKL